MHILKRSSLLTVLFLLIISCSNEDDPLILDNAFELPPFETMMADFEAFTDNPGSGKIYVETNKSPEANWTVARVVVGVWNTALFTTLTVPVNAFRSAFLHDPERITDTLWQWTYTVEGFTGEYHARLTGELIEGDIFWNMYITRTGIEAFDEFLWFTGVSDRDGNSGHWILNQGPERQDALLRIDWVREAEEVGTIR